MPAEAQPAMARTSAPSLTSALKQAPNMPRPGAVTATTATTYAPCLWGWKLAWGAPLPQPWDSPTSMRNTRCPQASLMPAAWMVCPTTIRCAPLPTSCSASWRAVQSHWAAASAHKGGLRWCGTKETIERLVLGMCWVV